MQVDRIGAGCNASPNQADDLRDQRIVLTHVLALHPSNLTVPDLVREISAGSADFARGDKIERAVRDLTGVGLLNCPGGLVTPSHAAVRFDALLNL
jgi:hypothetical protein